MRKPTLSLLGRAAANAGPTPSASNDADNLNDKTRRWAGMAENVPRPLRKPQRLAPRTVRARPVET
ncbi:MAG: hypothetical protein RLZZ15_2820 [Verrucomicrobiota bacterium]|jgi:hypothetical protein